MSATTDGFITDQEELEAHLISSEGQSLFKSFRNLREELSGDPRGLEVKNEGLGIRS